MIRPSHTRAHTEDGQHAEKYFRQGHLAPNEIVSRLTFGQLDLVGVHGSWLLDGYPRTLEQARLLCDRVQVSKAIWLQVPEDEIIRRIQQRLIHPASGRVYHLEYRPPLVPGRDDETGEPLAKRPDDEEEAVRQRLLQFAQLTQPVLQFFRQVCGNKIQ